MSKGSNPRPFSVSNEEYARRWDAIFQRDVKEEKNTDSEEDKATRYNEETQAVKTKEQN